MCLTNDTGQTMGRAFGLDSEHLICHRCRLVAALQNGIMQVGRMRLAGIKGDPNTLGCRIGLYLFHSVDTQKWLSQGTHAFVAIVSLRCYIDCLQHFAIGRVVQIMWIGWVHILQFAARDADGRMPIQAESTKRLPSLSLNKA